MRKPLRITIPAFVLEVDPDAWATEYAVEATDEAVTADVLTYYTPEDMIGGSPLAHPLVPGTKAAVTVVRS